MAAANDSFNLSTQPVVSGLAYFALAWPPLFLLIGIPGNVISFIIWYRRIANSPGSTCLILAVMCATDTYVLVHGCFRNWMRTYDENFIQNQSFSLDLRVILHCQTPLFLFTLASDLSVWLIILLCVERFISVWFPIHMKEVCHRRRGVVALLALLFGLALVNSILFLVVERVEEAGSKPACRIAARVTNTSYYDMWNYVDFAVYSFIPLAMIVLLNYFILFKLHQTRARTRARTATPNSTTAPRSQAGQASGRIFKTVAVMCICHFVFTQPIVVFFLSEHRCGTPNRLCDILLEVFLMLQMANHLTHFFIYSWTSSVFHADLMRVLECCCPGHRSTDATSTASAFKTKTSIVVRFRRGHKNQRGNTLLTNHTDMAHNRNEKEPCCQGDETVDDNGVIRQ